MQRSERRALLVSKGWIQAVALVILFGFFVLGLLAYRHLHGQAADAATRRQPTGRGALHGRGHQQGPAGLPAQRAHAVRLGIRPRRVPRPRLHRRLPAARIRDRPAQLWRRAIRVRCAEIEITGTDGTLQIADPTFPDDPVRIYDGEWRDLPLTGTTAGRGVGALEMARVLRNGHPHRATAEIALHVLDVMTAIIESADRAEFLAIPQRCERPAALPPDWDPHAATLHDDQERVR